MGLEKIAPTFLLLLTTAAANIMINCQNGGNISYQHCKCPPGSSKDNCELPAYPLASSLAQTNLTHTYSYYYFQPNQVNYYRLNFTVCMLKNPSELATQIFVSAQKKNGTMIPLPAFFEKFKLILGSDGCTNFSSHYISVKRKQDDTFRKVIVGLRVLPSNASDYYFNVFASNSKQIDQSLEKSQAQLPTTSVPPSPAQQKQQILLQSISISMTYETYIQSPSYSNFIIIFTSFIILVIIFFLVFYIRQKYTNLSEDQPFTLRQIYGYPSRQHNPEQDYYQYDSKNDLTLVEAFMPVTSYGVCSKYFISEDMRSCKELPSAYPENQCCSICLLQFEVDDKIRTTPCRHRYHQGCIDSWCETNLSCPICRRPLDFTRQLRAIYLRYLRGQLI